MLAGGHCRNERRTEKVGEHSVATHADSTNYSEKGLRKYESNRSKPAPQKRKATENAPNPEDGKRNTSTNVPIGKSGVSAMDESTICCLGLFTQLKPKHRRVTK